MYVDFILSANKHYCFLPRNYITIVLTQHNRPKTPSVLTTTNALQK